MLRRSLDCLRPTAEGLQFVLWLVLLGGCARPLEGGTQATPGRAAQSTQPPVAERRPRLVKASAGEREDEYYWLRDDTRAAPDVLAYVRAENAYTDQMLAPLAATQRTIHDELVARIP